MGCGNPFAMADLLPGETVLDLGSGGGLDVILSAKRVGPTGKAYGIDFLDEMLDIARANAAEMVGVARLSGEYDISVPLISAGLMIALIPVFIVYIVFQKLIHGGAMSGAVK